MKDGSPLAVYTRDTARGLQDRLGPEVIVDWAMRYGNPSIGSRLAAMVAAGRHRIRVAPPYPHYSEASPATPPDAGVDVLGEQTDPPAIPTPPPSNAQPWQWEAGGKAELGT